VKVALLNPAFWPEVQRGSERVVHDLAADMAARGHATRLITSHPGPTETSELDGFTVVRNRRPPERLLELRRIQPHLSHVPLSYRSLQRGDDDIAHAFFHTDALASVRWAQRTGRPSVFSYMGLPSRATATFGRGRMRILAHVFEHADAVVGLSRAACDALWRWWGVEARLIHPGVDVDAFSRNGVQRSEIPTIACAASPDDGRKRVPLLVDAFERVRAQRPDARLRLQAPRDPAAREKLARPGVELYDARPDEVGDEFARAWVTALPSREEAFGLVVVESLATGTPVVAANEAGPAEILDRDGIGRLFDEPTPEAVANALLAALELAEDNGTPERARRRAADFTHERCASEHEALYQELLAR
jgi:glycosyltransferase involved in cell wall biosynthesis